MADVINVPVTKEVQRVLDEMTALKIDNPQEVLAKAMILLLAEAHRNQGDWTMLKLDHTYNVWRTVEKVQA